MSTRNDLLEKILTATEGSSGGVPRSELSESTGLKLGGLISQGVGDTIDYTAYSGVIVNATTYPNIDTTVFGEAGTYNVDTSVDGTYLLAVDATNTFIQIDVNSFGPNERRDNANFGAFTVAGGSLVSVTPARQDSNEVYQQLLDLMGCLGTIRCDGLNATPSGLLEFDVTSGIVMSIGAGATNGERPQNTLSVNAAPNASFRTLLGTTNTVNPVSQTSIDPANYDDGSGSAVAIGGSGARSTIQYIYLIPTGPDASIYVMYGQTVYSTLQDALDAGIEDKIELPSLYAKAALLLGRVAVRNDATDLTDPLQARFLAGARFGSGLVGGSAASGAGGGDVFGTASSVVDEIFTAGDASGKLLKESGVQAYKVGGDSANIVATNRDLNIAPASGKKVTAGNIEYDASETRLTGDLLDPSGNPIPYAKKELNAYGYQNSTATTMTAGNYVVMTIPSLTLFNSSDFSAVANGVEYTGSGFNGELDCTVIMRTPSVSGNPSFDFRVFVNGVAIGNWMVHKVGSNDPTSFDVTIKLFDGDVTINNGDVIDIRCKGGTTNTECTVKDVRLKAIAY